MMNKYCCLIILYFICRICEAQTPDWEWARSAVNYSSIALAIGEGIDVASDASGNAYVTGWFQNDSISFGSITLFCQNPKGYYTFVTKYDSSGNVLWANKSGGTGVGLANSIATDISGNVYITGMYDSSYISFGNDTLNYNGKNIFLTKYDSSGNVLWAKNAGGTSVNAVSNSVATDVYGNVYITGFFGSSTMIFDSDTLINNGLYNIFTAKYDSTGNVLWAKSAQGSSYDLSYSVASDTLGNSYITGYFASPFIVFDTDTLFNSGPFNTIFIAKYDVSGNIVLAKSSVGGGGNIGRSIVTNSSGDIYIAGNYNSTPIIFGSDTLLYIGNNNNTFFVKYDMIGNVLWAKSITEAQPYKIILDSADNVYMTGNMGYPGMPITFDSLTLQLIPGSTDPMFVAKFDSSGNVLWAKALQSGGDDHNGSALGPNGSLYLTSDYYNVNPFILGCDTLILTGQEDIFVGRLGYNACQDTIVAVYDNQQVDNIVLFPNPFNANLNVRTVDNQQSVIMIYDILSKKLLQQTFTNSVSLNTKQFENGIYIYEVRNNNGVIKKGKIVKN